MANEPAKSPSLFSQALRDELKDCIREVLLEGISSNGNGHAALLTAEQLAEALQVNKATIYERVKKKSIPFYQVGRFARFNLREVLENERKRT